MLLIRCFRVLALAAVLTGGGEHGCGAGAPPAPSAGAHALHGETTGHDGQAGKAPSWAPLAKSPAGCPVERITNPSEVRAFTWRSCDDESGCEELSLSEPFAGAKLYPNSAVNEERGETRVMLSLADGAARYALFAYESGRLFDAYRISGAAAGSCAIGSGAAWGARHGVVVLSSGADPDNTRVGGILGSIGSEPPAVFDVTPAPLGYGPAEHPMGANRWMWRYSPDKLLSLSTLDGSGITTIAAASGGDILALERPVTTGPSFLFGEVLRSDDGAVRGIIASSDGVAPPRPYLVPPDDSFYGFPVFAGSHVAWFRGVDFVAPNKYRAVEVWASPYSEDPALLAPYKVDDFAATGMTDIAGGHGRIAVPSLADAPAYGETHIWDLKAKTRRSVVLPRGRRHNRYLGLTSRHVWITGAPQGANRPDIAVRFAVNDGG